MQALPRTSEISRAMHTSASWIDAAGPWCFGFVLGWMAVQIFGRFFRKEQRPWDALLAAISLFGGGAVVAAGATSRSLSLYAWGAILGIVQGALGSLLRSLLLIQREPTGYALEERLRTGADIARRPSRVLRGIFGERRAVELPPVGRVVNSWFSRHDEAVPRHQTLAAGKMYSFQLQIGLWLPWSNVWSPRGIPEKQLEPFYGDEGLALRVVLVSRDFKLDKSEQELRLPKPPKASRELRFEVHTPVRPGRARLRASVYFRNNLLQSLVVDAVITAKPRRVRPYGNSATVDFALTGSLEEVEWLPERRLNILTNESGDGTHTFAIVGSNVREEFWLTEGEMRSKVDEARQELERIAVEKERLPHWLRVLLRRTPRYRFAPDHRGSEADFVSEVCELATLGYSLYVDLVTDKKPRFEIDLRRELAGKATIQVSVTRSAKYVFPWAVVYDKELVKGGNLVCPETLEALRQGGAPGFLANHVCFTSGCPHAGDPQVICPSGFWGFKHLVEQPLSRSTVAKGKAGVMNPQIFAGSKVDLLMAVSLRLDTVRVHQKEMGSLGGFDVEILDSKDKLGRALPQDDFQVLYFFCHGGRRGAKVWLGIGDGEKLLPSDLHGWRARWPKNHPLVVINGCATAGMTPDDLLQFNKVLAWGDASGVIGTEISIPETLGTHFAGGFFGELEQGTKIGEAIRRYRLGLLERYNLLGLVYTPYCYADLQVVRQSSKPSKQQARPAPRT